MISSKLIPPPPQSLHQAAGVHKFSTRRTCQPTKPVSSPSSCLYPRKVELVCNYSDQRVAPKDPGTGPETAQPLRSPLEPVLRAVVDKYPNYNFSSLDFIVSRSNLRDLFKLISASKSLKKSPGELKYYVELVRPARGQVHSRSPGDVRGTVLLTSGTLQDEDTEVMGEDVGDDHGAEFLEYHSSTLIADNLKKSSLDEATVVAYDFAGMRCMVKYAPRRGLSGASEEHSTYQETTADDGKCRRVRRKTKIRPVNEVNEWMQKVPHMSSPCAISAEFNDDHIDTHEENFPVMTTDNNTQVARDVEAWRLEQDDQLVDLRNDIERLKLHSLPRIEVDDDDFPESRESKSTAPYLMPSHHNRQRGDSVSSTSSALSQTSTRSMVSSRSSVSGAGDSSHFYHPHKRLQLLPTIASTPPNEVNDLPKYTGFDTPLSNIWYRMNVSSLFDVEAVEPGELEDSPPDPNAAVVGTYRSTTRYQSVLKAWEKEHLENLNKLVGVLRKIRKAAEKAGRCKIVVESSGKIRPYRVKQSAQEREAEIGRVSILPKDLLERWV